MFDTNLDALDADATLTFAADARSLVDRVETRIIEAAAHYADLNGHLDARFDSGSRLAGMERLVTFGGDGTPEVAEFAPAELGAELQMSQHAAARLIGDALDLRHRLPRLWRRVLAGEVKPWIGRRTAEATRRLPRGAVAVIDAKVSPWAHSLSWRRLEAIVEAACIEADPAGAAELADNASRSQGVWLGQSNDHGIKDIFIRTQAPNAIWFDASIERIAEGLQALGDLSTKDVRRGRAVGVLAQPQRALDLFDRRGSIQADPSEDYSEEAETCRLHDAEVPAPRRGSHDDPRPPATLYLHLSQQSFTRDASGVARFEGVGPITTDQARSFLSHCHVTIRPVIDLPRMAAVDAYEVPDLMREAVHLRSPVDVFPYASNTSRRRDIDHTNAYRDPDTGGPPGQTRLDNLGPMTRFHHRIKTHGRWQVRQPFNGFFVWRSPHGRMYVVDSTGTTKLAHVA
ncbi:MAG: DUF222 domain-containing protein [Nocardioidaceae bacterium]